MIFGRRVRLRRVERADLPRFVDWLNDPEVRDGLALIYPLGLIGEEKWFESTFALEPALQPFAIDARTATIDPRSGTGEWTHVGSTGLHRVDWRNRWAELGIVVGNKDYWDVGHGADAIHTLCAWCFGELNLHRLQLQVFEDNVRAIRCYEKVGFRVEGRLRQSRFHAGRYFDTLVMGLLADELRD